VALKEPARAPLQLERHGERAAVPLKLRQRGEADQVGEQEGVARLRHSDTARYPTRYRVVCQPATEQATRR
jgi:hypothetical protein